MELLNVVIPSSQVEQLKRDCEYYDFYAFFAELGSPLISAVSFTYRSPEEYDYIKALLDSYDYSEV